MEVRNYNKLTISEILSRAFNILKDNFVEVLKVIGIFIIPTTVITAIVILGVVFTSFIKIALMSSYYDIDEAFAMMGLGTMLLAMIIGIISGLIVSYANAIIIKIIDDANKNNQVSWKSANSYIWERKWKVIGLNVLVWLIFFFAIIIFIILGSLLSVLTFGVGFIIFIPALIAIGVIAIPLWSAFSSMLIVNDLNITDAIGETFSLFRKGYFWSTIGNFAAISGITIGIGILVGILSAIPFLGFIVAIVGQTVLNLYLSAYITIYVLDRTKPLNTNNTYSNFNSNFNSNHQSINNDYNGLNNNYNKLNDSSYNNGIENTPDNTIENNNKDIENSDKDKDGNDNINKDNNGDNGGFIDPIN